MMNEDSRAEPRRAGSEPSEAALLSALKDRALDTAQEGITISDARVEDNPLIYVNRGFEILTGYRSAEVLGTNCRFLQGPKTERGAVETIRRAIQKREPCVAEILNYHKNGTPFWNRLSITPVRDDQGQTTHFIGVQSDLTDRRRVEDDLRAANQEMQRALEAAARIQRNLLPHDFPASPRLQLVWRLEPSETLAGDILNAFWLDEHRLACYVLDVAGHGVAAALFAVTLSHFLKPPRPDDTLLQESPDQIANRLNDRFPFDSNLQQFFTLLYGVLDIRSGIFDYVSAGHPPLLHVPRKGPVHISRATGFPIGIMEHPGYKTHRIQLQSGDRLFLYSDGVYETAKLRTPPWGIEGLADFIGSRRSAPLSALLDQIFTEARARQGEAGLPDDFSVMALELTPPA